ncbi:hypothetical protein CONPUDRAFT_154836 [Coniophora puteana RWD-64-598 SS2]|uniref:Uncharacterized protein n=1 Tax=Coniophora puteana (strain RWD-64-598) TaxID=741705 RepID=A0A5M3MP78_CONPW|nr:uncharacterized protein CONPUDRAFT_154836 [Coniophora puteana RWD-64-598 SS2]EIW80847.1 hypothetical protein CONPUDRAFT_154836 [Coniophora puteana RWD-64-598 SS2]
MTRLVRLAFARRVAVPLHPSSTSPPFSLASIPLVSLIRRCHHHSRPIRRRRSPQDIPVIAGPPVAFLAPLPCHTVPKNNFSKPTNVSEVRYTATPLCSILVVGRRIDGQITPNICTDDWNAYDALALGVDGSDWLISSPNSSFVCEYRNTSQELRARKDGRLGPTDPFQWPTLFQPSMPWVALYPRRSYFEADPIMSFCWWTPADTDVVWKDATTHTTGLLDDAGFSRMQALMTTARTRETNFCSTSAGENNRSWLRRAIRRLQDVLDRFRRFPSSLRSIILDVADFQRGVMDIWAFTEWWLRVKNGFYSRDWTKVEGLKKEDGIVRASPMYMGCFSTEPFDAEDLYAAGIPVWIPRSRTQWSDSSNSISLVNVDRPRVVIEDYHENGVDMRYPVLHTGPPSLLRIVAARFGYGHSHEDPESFKIHGISTNDLGPGLQDLLKRGASSVRFLNSEAGPSTGPSRPKPSKSKRSTPYTRPSTGPKKEQRDKWAELTHEFWPAGFNAWRVALKEVDKSPSRVRNVAMNGGYFFPEPALFCGVTDFSRLARYVENWLAIREPWINYVRTSPPELPPKGQNWRDFLNGAIWDCTPDNNGSGSERDKARMLRFLQPVLLAARANRQAPSIIVRGTAITREQMQKPEPVLMRRLLWDLFNLSFAAEFVAVDQLVKPTLWTHETAAARRGVLALALPSHFGACPDTWPSSELCSFGGTPDNVPAVVNAIRDIVRAWPGSPDSLNVYVKDSHLPIGGLTDRGRSHLFRLRIVLTKIYAQAFFDQFGRPPVLPHCFPEAVDGSMEG